MAVITFCFSPLHKDTLLTIFMDFHEDNRTCNSYGGITDEIPLAINCDIQRRAVHFGRYQLWPF